MRLLIIEDDRESADYLVKAFREVGYVADLASDGEEGLALADTGDYDVLVIDRMLPKRDGLSLIGTLRDKGNRTPALILSALGQVDDRIKGLRAGGDDYLPKPYSFAELLARASADATDHGRVRAANGKRIGLAADVLGAGRSSRHGLFPEPIVLASDELHFSPSKRFKRSQESRERSEAFSTIAIEAEVYIC